MQTLLLSPEWEPLTHIGLKRVVRLLLKGRIEVLEEYEDRYVRSATWEVKVPAVVRLLKWFKGKRKGVRFSRENVFTRDKGRCQYCNTKLMRHEATYDHVIPRSQGGTTRWENIVIACVPCNQKKGGRTPEQARMRLTVEPVRPKYLPETLRLHFSRSQTPEEWKGYLRSVVYMHGELESD